MLNCYKIIRFSTVTQKYINISFKKTSITHWYLTLNLNKPYKSVIQEWKTVCSDTLFKNNMFFKGVATLWHLTFYFQFFFPKNKKAARGISKSFTDLTTSHMLMWWNIPCFTKVLFEVNYQYSAFFSHFLTTIMLSFPHR